ncbi:hypothetical protein GD1_61 [Paraglaciecola Antarctic GD virus 1]|nr:hypothetical protein GD1_61 [Paraglaciecola Antarctic GD virus 1]
MNVNDLKFEGIRKTYMNITRNPRTAKYRVRREFGLFITDSRIMISLMHSYINASKTFELEGRNTYPNQETIARATYIMNRTSVDVLAHLYKCSKV